MRAEGLLEAVLLEVELLDILRLVEGHRPEAELPATLHLVVELRGLSVDHQLEAERQAI